MRTAGQPYGLSTKLTGAGGGGCAVTLVPDGVYCSSAFQSHSHLHHLSDFKEESLQSLVAELSRDNFDPYLTSVGGSGLGILSPYEQHRSTARSSHAQGQVTPPETPGEYAEIGRDSDNAASSLRSPFETSLLSDLSEWAESQGRWLFV